MTNAVTKPGGRIAKLARRLRDHRTLWLMRHGRCYKCHVKVGTSAAGFDCRGVFCSPCWTADRKRTMALIEQMREQGRI